MYLVEIVYWERDEEKLMAKTFAEVLLKEDAESLLDYYAATLVTNLSSDFVTSGLGEIEIKVKQTFPDKVIRRAINTWEDQLV